jgi:hypothetical protein
MGSVSGVSAEIQGLSKNVSSGGLCREDHVGVYAERDRWVGVAESGGDDVDWDAGQKQRGRVDMAKVVQAGVRQGLLRGRGGFL